MKTTALRPYPTAEIDPHDQRRLEWARDIVAAMSVPEKIAQLHQYSPGVERLGIAPFVTGTEGLHGVAWRGPATQFPQPAGMAASWDPALLRSAAAQIAAEVRAMHEEDPSVSLDVWAPVVNPLRHPLWGRSEEGYTEDPHLNAELACGFSSGLKGDGDTWTTLPTLKHFLAYSNETDRDATSSDLSPRVLHEYELPGHVAPLVRGRAASVMLAYNLVNGRPAHVTDLLESQLRSQLVDPDLLFVVSDAGAPSNLFRSQKVAADAAEAYAAMLRAGVDSFTDNDADPTETIAALTAALEQGLIEEDHLDRAVVRQLTARARTGEFDSAMATSGGDRHDADDATPAVPKAAPAGPEGAPARVPRGSASTPGGSGTSAAPLSRAAANSLAREVATRSAVLLSQRDRAALPLRPGRTAVIGEQAHTVLRDWYSGEFHQSAALADALPEHAGQDVLTSRSLDRVSLSVLAASSADLTVPSPVTDGVLLTSDSSLRCARPAADGPAPVSAAAAQFEVLDFGGDLIALREVTSRLLVTADERGRLTARAERIGGWVAQEVFRRTICADGTWQLQHTGSGRFVGVEHHSGALTLHDHTPGDAARFAAEVHAHGLDEFAAAVQGADSVILVIGNDPHIHGRETADRPDVHLPEPARAAAEHLAALPDDVATILVITSSYPYDLDGLEERIDAVVWSAHAGEAEGEALADLLTGRRDFSGRLAQTWPGSAELPSVLDYDVISTSSTYLYGQESRFAFGHGLATDPVQWKQAEVAAGADALHVEVALSAPASRRTAGPLHETVQVYADVPEQSFSRRHYTVPRTRLVGFATTQIPESGSVTARIRVPYARLALFAPDREAWELPDGPVTIRLSRSSSDPVLTEELRIPAEVLAATQLPPAPTGRVPADRAEETSGLARSAITLLEGTELRPTGSATGWADLVLDAGTVVTGVETRPLRSPGGPTARAELIDPDAEAASAAALPLPHTVPAEQGRPTGRVRVRLVGPLALTGLQTQQR